jgi:hypothetical protein
MLVVEFGIEAGDIQIEKTPKMVIIVCEFDRVKM